MRWRQCRLQRLHRDDLGALLSGDYLTLFGLDRCCEELASVTALAREHEVPAELAALVEHTCHRALSRFGPVGGELLAVALLEEEGVGGPIMPCSAVARRAD